ncbi:uncharacterized protein LOC135464911 isoform X1 [Liolophura sinensis]|uniref:uncharacterized protein LOC135464911 isoform X1 n=1 Tax=Liolophura sinensis TaxID=3198878 RepID=UPI0031580A29
MGGFLGLLPFLYLNAALASAENGDISNSAVENRNYLSRFPSQWKEVGRRGGSDSKLRKMALGLGKRFSADDVRGVAAYPDVVGVSQDALKQTNTGIPGTAVDQPGSKGNSEKLFPENTVQSIKELLSPVMTTEELARQLRDNPRLAKAIVDAWIDTNNDGIITGSEILGRK